MKTDTLLANIHRVSRDNNETFRRFVPLFVIYPAIQPLLSGRVTRLEKQAGNGVLRYGEARGKEVSDLDLQRAIR